MLHLTIAQVALHAVAAVRGQASGLRQRIFDRENGQRILRIRGTGRQVADPSKRLLKRELPIRVDDIRGVENPVTTPQRCAVAGAPGQAEPGREVFVIGIDQAARIAILSRKHLLAGRKVEAGNPVVALDRATEVFPAQSHIRRKAVSHSPVVLYVITHVCIRQVWRKRSGLDCITRRVPEKQIGQRIVARGGRQAARER